MPDHQIVIKLDKDQFDEAQRLAKIAGFRSASSYIREKIVSLIRNNDGVEGSELEALVPNLPRKIKNIDNDLSRIQHELQLFILETDLTPIPIESIVEKQTSDTIFDNQLSFAEFNDKTGATIDLDDPEYATTEKSSSYDYIITDDTKKEVAKHVPVPDKSAHEKEKSVWQSGDKTSDTTAEEKQLQPDSSYKEKIPEVEEAVQAAEVANDELEEMADRAFSISPRLGALDPSRGPIPLNDDDPLADLLDEHLVDKLITPLGRDWDFEPEPQETLEDKEEKEEKTEEPLEKTSESKSNQSSDEISKKTETKEKKKKKKVKSDPPVESKESKTEEKNESEEDKSPEEDEEDVRKHDLSGGPPLKRRKK